MDVLRMPIRPEDLGMKASKVKKLSPAEIASYKAKVQACIAKSQYQAQAWPDSSSGTSRHSDDMREECILAHPDVTGDSESDEKPMMLESREVNAAETRPRATRPFVPEANPACTDPAVARCDPNADEPREGGPRWIELMAMQRLLAPPRRQWPQACFEASPRSAPRPADHRASQAYRRERPKSAAAHPSMANRQHTEDVLYNSECTARRIQGARTRGSSIGAPLQGDRTMEMTTRVPKSVSPEMHQAAFAAIQQTRPTSAPRATPLGRNRRSCGQACAEPRASSCSPAQLQTKCETSDPHACDTSHAGWHITGKLRGGTMSAAPTMADGPSTEKVQATRGGATKRRPKSASLVGQTSKAMLFQTAPAAATSVVKGSIPKSISKSVSASNLYVAAPRQHAHVGDHNPQSVLRRRDSEKQQDCCRTVKAAPSAKQQDRAKNRRRCSRQRVPDISPVTSKGLSLPKGAGFSQTARSALLAADRLLAEGRAGQ